MEKATLQVQYKIVKVRKPDGTIVKVRRPISEEATQAPVPAKNSKSAIVVISTPIKPTSTEVVPTVNENSNTVVTEVKSTTQVTQSEKTTATSAKEPQKPTDTVAKGARHYRGLHKLHRGSLRLISVLAPGWGIDDLQKGDEEIDDDDSDNENDEQYESDEEQNGHNNSANHGTANINTNTAAKSIATTTTVTDLATSNTAKAQSDDPEKGVPVIHPEKDSLETPENTATKGRDLTVRCKDWSRYIVWVIMITFPVLFIIVGILVAHRIGHNTEDVFSFGTQQALEVAVSTWPIIFAGIVAQSLRAYATYRVERGVRLMTLEQLVNSNSVASSIKQPFLLRRFNLITIALLMLWSLSPLATQAMERVSSTHYVQNSASLVVRFTDTTANGTNFFSTKKANFSMLEADFNRLYVGSFLWQDYQFGQDAYGNPLIPLLNRPWMHDPSNQSWLATSPDVSDYPTNYSFYASAYGIPIAYFEGLGNVSAVKTYYSDAETGQYNLNLYIPAAYLDFECSPFEVKTYSEIFDGTIAWGSLETVNQKTLLLAMTPMLNRTNGTLALASMITRNTTIANDIDVVDFGSMTWATTSCNFTPVYLNASIICSDNGCYTNETMKIDISRGFDLNGTENFVNGILGTSGSTNGVVIATDTEKFLASTTGDIMYAHNKMNLTTANLSTFTQNLAFLVNTFWSIGFSPKDISTFMSNSSTDSFNDAITPPPPSYAAACYMVFNEVYQTSTGWLIVLFMCSGLLLIASIFSILWDSRSVSPDVLGFASTVVRKSKYVKLPKVDSAAGGAERARALGDVRVMMQDVKLDALVGRIALGTAHLGAKRLESGRNYR